MNKHIVQLIRERFHPLVRFCGPQHAGEVEVEGTQGPGHLGELSIWLWLAKNTHNGVLSDEQLGDVVSPHLLVRNLPLSANRSMRGLLCHLDRIEAADGDTVSLLRYYLEDPAASRLWDLLPVVRNHVYHPAFAGSYSLKSVLPALVPEMSYAGMQVADGQDAGWLGSRSSGEAWIKPSATGLRLRCELIAGKTRWRWSSFWKHFD